MQPAIQTYSEKLQMACRGSFVKYCDEKLQVFLMVLSWLCETLSFQDACASEMQADRNSKQEKKDYWYLEILKLT